MHKISNDEINITKDIKIKDIRCNNKVITNIVEFNRTISHSIKYSENICWFWYGNFKVILRGNFLNSSFPCSDKVKHYISHTLFYCNF